jgi:hypothetical protein
VPFNPRNPQQQSNTGQAKDNQARGSKMRIIPSIRSLLFALVMLAIAAASFAQIGISITFAPPALPVYEQPPVPGEGYIWTPGYWAYGDDDYYWVPGTWVMAPEPGFLWTPGYWGWGNDRYVFYDGYWGPQVGFYGGINYGYGYFGEGYEGGRWQNGQFFYNRSINNVNVTNIHNVYNTTVINNTTVNRVSFNGGNGGIDARPTPREETVAHEKHIPPVAVQTQHAQAARADPELRASANHGKPPVAATPKPGAFKDRAAVPAKEAGAPYSPAGNRAAAQPGANMPAVHQQNNVPRPDRPAATNPEANRPPAAQTNSRPEPNRNEPAQRAQTPPPNEGSQPRHTAPPAETRPVAQEQQRPEPNRNQPAQRAQTPNEVSQPRHTAPPAETRPAAQQQQRPQPAAEKPEVKKPQDEQPPKGDEKPPK